jgi:RimJ/RimL family protein N-acetyltransferase/SAM-dependent methyltransferase
MELHGEAIVLRSWEETDAPLVFEACQDPEIQHWIPILPRPYTRDDAHAFVTGALGFGPYQFAVVEAGRVAGSIGLRVGANETGHIGYWCAAEARGRGIATRALRRVCRYALDELELDRLELTADVENFASQRVAEKVGFQREGVVRSALRDPEGHRRDSVRFSLLPGELRLEDPERSVAPQTLSEAWERTAAGFTAWARAPGHDSYWRFHRDQFLDLVPAPGRLTLDIGCGEGRLSRDLTAQGHTVVAVDSSPTMVENARQADASIEVRLADAARLPFSDAVADLAIAFMSLHDIDDMAGAVDEAARVLVPGGRFCIAIVHPLNSAGTFASEEADSPFVIAGSYLESFRYTASVERDGLEVTLTSDHHPLEAYVEALAEAGFFVERMREHAVPDAAIDRPRQRRWQRLPLFLHLRAVRR